MSDGKQVPNNEEAEQAILGSILLDRNIIGRVSDIVTERDFYFPKWAAIYAAMLKLFERGENVDILTISEELQRANYLEAVGGEMAVASLAMVTPTPIHAESYARIVARCAAARRLVSAGGRIAQMGWLNEIEPEDAVREAERQLAEVLRADTQNDFVTQQDALSDFVEAMRAKADPDQGNKYIIKTGLRDLDRMLSGGLHRQDLIVLAARPSMGKSGLGLTICTNAALASNGIAVFSLEMSTMSLMGRMLAYSAKVPLSSVDTGRWERYEDRIGAGLGRLATCKIWWNDLSAMTVERVRAMLRRRVTEAPIDIVMIDHAQLLRAEGKHKDRVTEMTEITRQLKAIAKDFNCAVILISQLSRAVEQRPNKQPILSDLRESGSIEQDADVVLLLYREEYYKPDTERVNIADLNVAKHRSGPTGMVSLSWNPATTGFWGLESVGA